MARGRRSRTNVIETLIGLAIFVSAFIYYEWKDILSWLKRLLEAMLAGIISSVIGIGEFLLTVGLPLCLGYFIGAELLKRQSITSGWGIVICAVFLWVFSYIGSGTIGSSIGFIAWGMVIVFGVDKFGEMGVPSR